MTLLYLWVNRTDIYRILNTTQGYEKGVFDHFVSLSEGYEKDEYQLLKGINIKKIKFEEDMAYFQKKSGEWIRTYTIHAQGKSKIFIPTVARKENKAFIYYMDYLKEIFKRVVKKIFKS